ncbi:virion morphogenesis protein, partial [Pasteurella multocida]|nr:virion morphogenesis protein [Pasteurella multocida]
MIDVDINDVEKIEAVLSDIAHKTQNRTSLMRSIAGTMESAVLQNFDEGGRPKWLGLKY